MKALWGQFRTELALSARQGEQLLVSLGVPLLILVFFSTVDVLPTDVEDPVDYLAPAVLAQDRTALAQGMDVGMHFGQITQTRARRAQKLVLHPQEVFAHDMQAGMGHQVMHVGDTARDRVLDGDDRPVDRAVLLDRAAAAEGLLCTLTDRIDAELLAGCPDLRAIANYAVGIDNIDLAAARERGIPVGNTPGVLTETTADLAFALILACARGLPTAEADVRAGRWTTWSPEGWLGRDVHGATLGIVGAGAIGMAVARRAEGFGMEVLLNGSSPGPGRVGIGELLERSDFVSLHCPLTEDTRHFLDARRIALMPDGAIVVNTARGPIVDDEALITALRGGKLAARLDILAHGL